MPDDFSNHQKSAFDIFAINLHFCHSFKAEFFQEHYIILCRENFRTFQKTTGTTSPRWEMRGIKNNEILEQKSKLAKFIPQSLQVWIHAME